VNSRIFPLRILGKKIVIPSITFSHVHETTPIISVSHAGMFIDLPFEDPWRFEGNVATLPVLHNSQFFVF
jgi:hypothetical protein